MILDNKAASIETNVEQGKTLGFGISDIRLVVDILSKLYAYPIQTLVQEYICNGRDAMRENGTWGTKAIKIGVPNKFEPTFKVRDYGCGITPDRMENIFVNYGSSTKRNSNTQTGGFGIGAKSAFAYTDSFSITSFVDGVKYLYVAHLGDEGGVNLVNKSATTEANGVEISIGVKTNDISSFREAVQRCIRYWSEPINLEGVADGELSRLKPTATLKNMTVYAGDSQTIYLIDGIEYPLMKNPNRYWSRNDGLDYRGTIAINIPNGFFRIASSRERLETNDDNQTKQDVLLAECEINVTAFIRSEITNPARSLTHKIEKKKQYCSFRLVSQSCIDLGNNCKLDSEVIQLHNNLESRYSRRTRRSGKAQYMVTSSNRFGLANTVIIDTSKELKPNTLARRLNHYLDQNPSVVLCICPDLNLIPHAKELFDLIWDSNDLHVPAPVPKVAKPKKSTHDAIVWSINEDGGKHQYTVENLNNRHGACVILHDATLTPEVIELAKFINVFTVPKTNKDLVTKKGMTPEQGIKYLLDKNSKEVVGLSNLVNGWDKVNVLKDFRKCTLPIDLEAFLKKNDPALAKQQKDMQDLYDAALTKYPLIRVLHNLSTYSTTSIDTVIKTVNEQSKEKA
jgi:hypothetical protein